VFSTKHLSAGLERAAPIKQKDSFNKKAVFGRSLHVKQNKQKKHVWGAAPIKF
jgi:hypothetical protein